MGHRQTPTEEAKMTNNIRVFVALLIIGLFAAPAQANQLSEIAKAANETAKAIARNLK
jgi:hypothetical protein